jgi:phospholipid N-methyltransferase
MSSPTVPYVLGGTQTEQQRLVAQAQGLEESARWMMDRINIKSGARAVDVGCGPIGITNLLSDRVGANGVVIGVEREPRFFEMARSEQSKRGLRNVQLVNADALKTGLDKNSCDFVHERLVLIDIPLASQQAVLEEISNRAEQLPSRNLILFRVNAAIWFCNSTPLNRPRANHQVARRFDERKKMCALVLTDLREVGVRMNPKVFRPRRSQQPSQRPANEQIATASGVECVTPSSE